MCQILSPDLPFVLDETWLKVVLSVVQGRSLGSQAQLLIGNLYNICINVLG